jgi:hypothetical protein
MSLISFAYTTPALLAGQKTVTRRSWNDDYARRFEPGDLDDAYDRSPRNKGKKVGQVKIRSVVKESIHLMPDSDYEAEGFAYLNAHLDEVSESGKKSGLWPFDRAAFIYWRDSRQVLYVVRFDFMKKENAGRYPPDWLEISRHIRTERAKNRCERCGVENYSPLPGGFKVILTVVHLNHRPEDCREENLKALCQRCHLRYDREGELPGQGYLWRTPYDLP